MATTRTDRNGFAMQDCIRCHGTGRYYTGTCFNCQGSGVHLTAKASKAKAEWLEANRRAGGVRMDEVKAGMVVVSPYRKKYRVTEDAAPDPLNPGCWKFRYEGGTFIGEADLIMGTPGVHVDPSNYTK